MNARPCTAKSLVVAATVSVFAAAIAFAQPPAGGGGTAGSAGGGQPGGPQAQQPMDAKALREYIDKRLEDHRQGIKRLEEASKKLSSGGDAAAIGKELFEQFREARRAGNQAPGGGQGRAGAGAAPGSGGGGTGWRMSEYDMATGPRLSPEERAKVRAQLDERHPELLRKVIALGGNNAEMTDRLIDGVGGRLRWLETMREKEPEEFRLRVDDVSTGLDVMKLGREITAAQQSGNSTAESAARGQLRTVMSSRFDTRQQLSRLKLKQLREQADKLEKDLAKNDQERDSVITRRIDEFLRLMSGKGKKSEAESPAAPARKP